MNWNDFKLSFLPKNAEQSKDRIAYLDFLKVLAAFLTVFYHFAYYKLDYGFDAMQGTYFPNFNRIVMCFASCCVPIFFIVNGTLLLGKSRSWKSVYIKAIKILVLTVVWSLAGFPSWFFKTLIILYLLFPLFQYLYMKKPILYRIAILLILVFPFGYNAVLLIIKMADANTAIHILGRTIIVGNLSVTGFFTMYSILYFLLGPILANKRIPTGLGVASAAIGLGLVVFECVSYTVMNGTVYDGVNAAFPTYGAMLLSAGIFVAAKNTVVKGTRIISWLGNGILPIYLMHMALIHIIDKLFEFTSIILPIAIVGTTFILFACVGVGRIASRVPVLCWFVRI